MSEELLVNVSPTETRVALIENGFVQEVHIERSQSKGYVGNIYKGKVVRVLPGMQAAFVDIGLARAGFIHATDIAPLDEEGMEARVTEVADIRSLVREGQALIVQVTKDPIGSKGARLTTHLSVSARFLVYMPYTRHTGISTRIEDEQERERLKALVKEVDAEICEGREGEGQEGGFIVRTVAEGVEREELAADIIFLYRLWQDLEKKIKASKAPATVHQDLPLFMRTLRDLVKVDMEKLRIDSREVYGKMRDFAEEYAPEIYRKIEHYPGERPLFDLYSVEEEIQRALSEKVQLKSGGYLI
ncbi:MAG: ribonuclease E/G, partial [Cellvibrionaceae bacterium]|nr:ribonuclease E/G [Cellvibrionaceae bacterium]